MKKAGRCALRFCSDHTAYGGSGFAVSDSSCTDDIPFHGFEQSLCPSLLPLAYLVLGGEP